MPKVRKQVRDELEVSRGQSVPPGVIFMSSYFLGPTAHPVWVPYEVNNAIGSLLSVGWLRKQRVCLPFLTLEDAFKRKDSKSLLLIFSFFSVGKLIREELCK